MKFEEEITDDEAESVETEAQEMKKHRPSRAPGLLLTIFSAIIVVLVGGLGSYYYYSFQSQGAAGEKAVRKTWIEIVGGTNSLLLQFNSISEFDKLNDTALTKIINTTNQTIRDGLFDIRAQSGLSIKASASANKLVSFLEDYSSMLVELKRLTSRVEEISDSRELDNLLAAGETASKSYDELLVAGGNLVQTKLPRGILDVPTDVEKLLDEKVNGGGTQSDKEKADQQAAEQVVSQFVQAWQSRNPDGMKAKLTKAAKSEFNAGIVEDSTDVTGFRITLSTVASDGAKVTIDGQLDKQTPDKVKTSEKWQFVLLKQDDNWLIDRWAPK